MAYIGDGNRQFLGQPVNLLPSGSRTAAGNGDGVDVHDHGTARLWLVVSDITGAGAAVTVTVEHSPDNETWTDHSSFAAASAAGTTRKVFAGLDRYVRVSWTLAGTTPDADFAVYGEAV